MINFERHPKKIVATLLVGLALCLITSFEIILNIFSPVAMTVAGYKLTENGQKYGWGFDSGQLIRVVDPDSGIIYQDRVNSKGWRDVEHNIVNSTNSFRILVIGDSNTFGYIVPKDALYTRILENKLRGLGYNIEIISMGYSGWGTDQQLEALKKEGLSYQPDLVIFQITSNDINDNFYWRDQGKFGRRKPFYFKINQEGSAERFTNQRFLENANKFSRNYIISQSQILMRMQLIKEKFTANWCELYGFGRAQIQQFELETGVRPPIDFVRSTRAKGECGLSLGNLNHLIEKASLNSDRELILNLASWPKFNEVISRHRYQMKDLNFRGEKWNLFFALIHQAAILVKKSGGKLALISDQEKGHYDWLRYWHRISGDPMTKRRYYMQTENIEKFANNNGIGFIKNRFKVQRALRDPHPNELGNAAMAENILAFVLAHFGGNLPTKF